jgi:uncharacterized membrane protein
MKKTTMATLTLIISTLMLALIAGLFYSYSCSVNPGLKQLDDSGYLAAMQSINRAIINPLFFLSFMGTLLFFPVSLFFNFTTWDSPKFLLLLGAFVLYACGTFGVTIFGNVPLNEALDTFPLKTATLEEISRARRVFEIPWNNLHSIRTVASVISLLLVIISITLPSKAIELITP